MIVQVVEIFRGGGIGNEMLNDGPGGYALGDILNDGPGGYALGDMLNDGRGGGGITRRFILFQS